MAPISSQKAPQPWTPKSSAMGAALTDPRVAEVSDVATSVALLHMRSGALCQIDSAPYLLR
jgi:hypothetical protein